MTELTWHLKQAKITLNRWYADFEELMRLASLVDKQKQTIWNIEGANNYRSAAIKCKTLGLVFHDRYKMVLDVQRGLFK